MAYIGKVVLKSGVFKKKLKVELSESFANGCRNLKGKKVAYIAANDDFVVIGNNEDKVEDNKHAIASLVGTSVDDGGRSIRVQYEKEKVQYRDVIGLYEWHNELFYKSKGSSGKCLSDNKSMMDKVKELDSEIPKSFGIKELGNISVTPVKLC